MLPSIHLDCQLKGSTVEIHDKITDNTLPIKFHGKVPQKLVPQTSFLRGHLPAQQSCVPQKVFVARQEGHHNHSFSSVSCFPSKGKCRRRRRRGCFHAQRQPIMQRAKTTPQSPLRGAFRGPKTTPQSRPVGARQLPLQGSQIKPGAEKRALLASPERGGVAEGDGGVIPSAAVRRE